MSAGNSSSQRQGVATARRGPNMAFVAGTAAVTMGTVFLAGTADPAGEPGILALASALGMFGTVLLVGLARQDIARRRRQGYIDTRAFFVMLNTAAVVGWLAGLFALYTLSYELSRSFT